jgi:hypothetical protein
MTPSAADVKRLFALSGNRCAFPKCRTSLVQGQTLIGEVCHIKAANPGGPRYDATQSGAERHGAANLILLCGTHHTVIDDDPEAYTVDRLLRMKADHEDHASPITDSDTVEAFGMLIDQSVRSHNQSGGITAHTVNLHAPPSSGVAETRTSKAIEALWERIGKLKREFNEPVFVDIVLTQEELRACFESGDTNPFFTSLAPYAPLEMIVRKFRESVGPDAESERPFVSARLYNLFFALQAVVMRAAMLIHLSFSKRRFQDWREDEGIDQHVRSVFTGEEVSRMKSMPGYSLHAIIAAMEAAFVVEADKCRRG